MDVKKEEGAIEWKVKGLTFWILEGSEERLTLSLELSVVFTKHFLFLL